MSTSLPLEVPPPGRPWHRASGILGYHIAATALMTCGWRGVPRVTVEDRSQSGGGHVTWYMAPRKEVPGLTIKKATQLVLAARDSGPEGLAAKQPTHPFLAALAALENMAALMQWQRTGGTPPVLQRRPGGVFCSLMADDGTRKELVQPVLPDVVTVWKPVSCGMTVAALLACGFVYRVDSIGGVLVSAQSLTMPLLTLEEAERVAGLMLAMQERPGLVQPLLLAGYEAEEHPFFYAFRAVMNYANDCRAMAAAGADPLRFLRSPRNEKRTAIITASLTDEGGPEKVKRALKEHLGRVA